MRLTLAFRTGSLPVALLCKLLSTLTLAVALSPLATCQAPTATQVRDDPIAPASATIDIPDFVIGGYNANSFHDSVGG
jgi:hypothetical protein